jgi:glycosyltransferase involved in cell wall biosynthesis
MRVLVLTKYTNSGASSRYRCFQFLPALTRLGFSFHTSPLLGDDYISALYQGRRQDPRELLTSFARRLRTLPTAREYDRVWITGELFPWLPALAEILMDTLRIPYVVDYDDALFHRYDEHPRRLVRLALGKKIDRVMAHATIVVAGNEYLAARARAAHARRVVIVPTVIDETLYPAEPPNRPDRFVIGWIGSPSTQSQLATLAPVLKSFCADGRAEVHAIGPREGFSMPGVPLTLVPWSAESEIAQTRRFSMGVMPLDTGSFVKGKCGFKLIQYMGCHLPVVASPIGANRDIVVPGETGFLPPTPEAWATALATLRDEPATARRLGANGRQRMLQGYSMASATPQLADALRAAR